LAISACVPLDSRAAHEERIGIRHPFLHGYNTTGSIISSSAKVKASRSGFPLWKSRPDARNPLIFKEAARIRTNPQEVARIPKTVGIVN